MVSAWYMDKSDSDQRDEHKCDPHRPLSLEELKKKTGVLYFPVSDCMAALANNTEMHNVSPPAYSVAGFRYLQLQGESIRSFHAHCCSFLGCPSSLYCYVVNTLASGTILVTITFQKCLTSPSPIQVFVASVNQCSLTCDTGSAEVMDLYVLC